MYKQCLSLILLVKNFSVVENTSSSSTLEGGVDFMESQCTAIPWLSKSIAVFQYIQVIIRLKLQDNISIPYWSLIKHVVMNCSDLSLMKSSQINRSLFNEYMTIFAVFKVLTKIIKC